MESSALERSQRQNATLRGDQLRCEPASPGHPGLQSLASLKSLTQNEHRAAVAEVQGQQPKGVAGFQLSLRLGIPRVSADRRTF